MHAYTLAQISRVALSVVARAWINQGCFEHPTATKCVVCGQVSCITRMCPADVRKLDQRLSSCNFLCSSFNMAMEGMLERCCCVITVNIIILAWPCVQLDCLVQTSERLSTSCNTLQCILSCWPLAQPCTDVIRMLGRTTLS